MPKELNQKTIDLELDMYVELKKYLAVDIQNMRRFGQQAALINQQLQKSLNPQSMTAVQNNLKTINYLHGRCNFAENCISFLTKKINQWKKKPA